MNKQQNRTPLLETPLIGRDRKLRDLEKVLGKVIEGRGHLVLLEGEAGVGKSRLVLELMKTSEEKGLNFLLGRSEPGENPKPYLPFTQAINQYIQSMSTLSPECIKVIADAPEIFFNLIPLATKFREVDTKKTQRLMDDLQRDRGRLFETISQLIITMSRGQPVGIVIEDIQWLDRTSTQLLHYIARNIHDSSIYFLITYRPDELKDYTTQTLRLMSREKLYTKIDLERLSEEETSDLIRTALCTTIHLERLDEMETGELIKNALGRRDLPDVITGLIYKEAEGNPLFTLELLKTLIEDDIIDLKAEQLPSEIEMSTIKIPDSIRSLILNRMGRLAPATQDVLDYATVIGNEFSYELLARVSGMTEDDISVALDEMMKKGLILEKPGEMEEYLFRNTQTQQVAYQQVPPEQLVKVHSKMGDAVEVIYSDSIEKHFYELAHHFTIGQQWEKALGYARQAAKKSAEVYALDEALSYQQGVLFILEHLPQTPENREINLDTLLNIGTLTTVTGQWKDALEYYDKSIAMAKELNNTKSLAQAHRKKGYIFKDRNEWDKALSSFNEAVKIAEKINDFAGLADAQRGMGKVHWMNGRLDDALKWCRRCIENAEKADDAQTIASTYIDLGIIHNDRGEIDDAFTFYNEGLKLSMELNNPYEIARAYNNIACTYQDSGLYVESIDPFERCIEVASSIGDIRWKGFGLQGAALSHAKTENVAKAEDYCTRAMDIFERLEDKYQIAGCHLTFGTIYSTRKEWEKAETHFQSALELYKEINQRYYLALAHFEYGLTQEEMGERRRGTDNITIALGIWKELGTKDKIELVEKTLVEWGVAVEKEKVKRKSPITEEIKLKSALVGRDKDLEILKAHTEKVKMGRGNVVFVEGEAGVGKTRLMSEFAEFVESQEMSFLYGRGLEGATPYLPFVDALRSYLRLSSVDSSSSLDLMQTIKDVELTRSSTEGRHGCYIVEDASASRSFELFRTLVQSGKPGLCLSTKYPEKIQEEYDLEGVDIFWLTDASTDARAINPKRLGFEITREIGNVVKAKENCAILLDGFEYLVLENGFHEVLRFTKKINDLATMYKATLLIPVNPSSFEPKEFAQLQGYMQTLASPGTRRIEDSEREKEGMFNSVLELIKGISAETPVAFFVDDVQWMDSSSLELLHYIGRNIHDNKILLVGAYRPEDVEVTDEEELHGLTRMLRTLSKDVLYDRLKLERLRFEDVSAMIDSMFLKNSFPEKFKRMIFNEGGGNPFFTEEILESLTDEGHIYKKGDKWVVKDFSQIKIPGTIVDVVLRRVERLDKDYRKMVEYMATIGQEFDIETLIETLNIDEEEVLMRIDELINLKFIKESALADYYEFDHGMIQEVVYNSISRSMKQIMHKKVANAIEIVHANRIEQVVFDLARHYGNTRDAEKAIEYSMLAGKIARTKYAIDESIKYYCSALDRMDKLREINEEMASNRINVLLTLGNLYNVTSAWDKAIECYDRCKEFSSQTKDLQHEAEAYCRIGLIKAENLSIWDEAKESLEKAISISESINDINGLANANRGLGYIHWRKGLHKDAKEHYDRSIEYAKKAENTHIMSVTLIELGNVYNMIGELEKGKELYIESLKHLEDAWDFSQMARAYNNLGDVYLQTDEWDKAIEYFEKCRKASEKVGNVYMTGWSYFNAGEAYARSLQFEKAKESLDKSYEILKNLGEKIGIAAIYQNYSIMYRLQKNWEESLKYLDDSCRMFEDLDTPYELGKVHADYARLYRDKGEGEKVKESYQKAMECFEKSAASREIEKIKAELGNEIS